ncbi:MAG: PDZ domain-containing protein [Candidatus Eisenbacteria bacterium]|nr:PDZ domain-containing protein [Candidatus Eisenbacteria bacterium]
MRWSLSIALLFLLPSALLAAPKEGYYRYPAIHGGSVIFVAEGDLWRIDIAGGAAQRLTTHPESEYYPSISPSGELVAFSASYEGPREIYTIPMEGGLPTRLTYDGQEGRVVGWTPAGGILYATMSFSTLPSTQLATLDPESGIIKLIPLAQAAEGTYDPESSTLFFTRFAAQGSHTKRYRGGTAQNIWKYGGGNEEAVPLTSDDTSTSRNPMWWDHRVYFISDRDGTMNIWSMNAEGADLRQHTMYEGWDVKDPDLSEGNIVYQLGADLYLYSVVSGESRKIPITLVSDFDQTRIRWVEKPIDYLTAAQPSFNGDRLALTARGQVFVTPAKTGRFVEVTRKPGVRYRQAQFLPDGKSLVALSDESGEVEWWRLPADGIGDPEPLTDNGSVLRLAGFPSPDGRWLLYTDQDQKLWLLEIHSGKSEQVAYSPQWWFDDPHWSPDSRYFLYGMKASNTFSRVYLYGIEEHESVPITSDRYESTCGRWDPQGEWIYFLSERHFRSRVGGPWGRRQPEPYFENMNKLYMIPLKAGTRSPFQPDDELHKDETDEKKPDGDGKDVDDTNSGESEKTKKISIDLEGIQQRLMEIPVSPGNYNSLSVTKDRLLWISTETPQGGRQDLMMMKIESDDSKAKVLVDDIRSYELTGDGGKLLIRKGESFYFIDASSSAPASLDDAAVNLSDWTFAFDPREEWRQMFVDSWRLERDYFYDSEMHGVDWEGVLAKYLPLVDRVTNRSELSDLQSQMAGELSALHVYIYGGDHREGSDEIIPASLGARLVRDESRGGFRIEKIYRTDPDRPDELSPLARPGIDLSEGDIITDINGVPALSVTSPGNLLRHQSGKQVRLRVQPMKGGDLRDIIVTPITQGEDNDLRYNEWEYTRRLRVEEQGKGEIGYLHLREMSRSSIAEWQREFYPVYNRQGLIIDVRHNGGGNIDSWILEKLMRRAWMYWSDRVGDTYWNMHYAFRGHMVVLVDEWTASDGEAFAEGFRRLGLGKVLGTRTWGGEIWLSSSNVLVDKGIVTAPESGVYGPEGEWLIEGHGVDPDIIIDNLPHATYLGYDAQLEAAIKHLQDLIQNDPRPVPPPPARPNKSFHR